MSSFLKKAITCFFDVGIPRANALQRELGIHTYEDLLWHFPYRYEDRRTFAKVNAIQPGMSYIQVKGRLGPWQYLRQTNKKILTAPFSDESGTIMIVWFNGLRWIQKKLLPNAPYLLFGKPTTYKKQCVFIHPELMPVLRNKPPVQAPALQPIYHTTAKLTRLGLHSKGLARLQKQLLDNYRKEIAENLPAHVLNKYRLMGRSEAFVQIHHPTDPILLKKAQRRFKFEEIFYLQLRIRRQMPLAKLQTTSFSSSKLLNQFYEHLPFALTNAQKKAIKEIYSDLKSNHQMNRLLQGDVGSGKTIVAFMSMLFPLAHRFQVALVAPTQILAKQHFDTIQRYAKKLPLRVALLTGATKRKERKEILQGLLDGQVQILVGTHALLEKQVQFQQLGLVVVDEQHRFGVAQRARLWQKQQTNPPHFLIMTATPIPRTLAMTLYSHLSLSTLDEMPPNRKPVKTYHVYEPQRLRVFGFIQKQIQAGKQVYVVYPRIEETGSSKDLMDGYESICRAFPKVPIGLLHGRMKPEHKAYEMQRFVDGKTKIMLATTVIEVGVNVPNANTILIENAEMFGLSQLHQLRGRVARSKEQAYCILLTKDKLSEASATRIRKMTQTSDGFELAAFDLELRGPGNLHGVEQSGVLPFKMVDFAQDQAILKSASQMASQLLAEDPMLQKPENNPIRVYVQHLKSEPSWIQIG